MKVDIKTIEEILEEYLADWLVVRIIDQLTVEAELCDEPENNHADH